MANQKRSGNPAKQAEITSAKVWKAKHKPIDVKLPSGNVALIKIPGLESLMAEGLVSDSLMPIIQEAIESGRTGKKGKKGALSDAELLNMLQDPTKLSSIMETMDRTLVYAVVEPPVQNHRWTADQAERGECTPEDVGKPIPDNERDEDILYTDEVDMDDKSFVFQLVAGGSADLEKFRKEYGESVDGLQSLDGSEGPTV